MKITEKILFLLLMVFLLLPAAQRAVRVFPIRDLQGDFVLAEKPEFSWSDWYTGDYQSAFDAWLEDHIGFRNVLVRVTNQLDFSLFGLVHAEGVVKGKNNMLYEYDYIREYTGLDFLGDEMIDKRIRQLKFIQQYLKNNLNIDFILVFEPGKASFYPENIPDQYLADRHPVTNYDVYTRLAKAYDVQFMDWNKWYINDLKPQAKYPLYPRYGIHWSEYGMTFALDSLIHYIERTRNIELREMKLDSLVVEDRARKPDYDVGAALNLLFRLPEDQPLAYPVYRFGSGEGKDFPNVLVVADSYYWNIYNTRIANELFGNQAYWYFGNKVYPETYYNPTFVSDLDMKEAVEKQDMIFLMVTGRFLYKFDWGIVDQLYRFYAPRSEYDKTYEYMAMITSYSPWFDDMVKQARDKNLPLSNVLKDNALYVYAEKEPEAFMAFRGQAYFEERIREDQNWLQQVSQKAQERGIALEEMITMDAAYVFQNKYPEAFDTYQQLQSLKQEIREDPDHLKKVRDEAAYYMLTFDEMLQIEAERMLHSGNER